MPAGEEEPIILSVSVQLRQAGRGMALIIDRPPQDGHAGRPDPKLVKLIARAHLFREKLINSGDAPLSRISPAGTAEPIVLRPQLSYLAADITRAILDGCQSRDLTVQKPVDQYLPLTWPEQCRLLGFNRSGSGQFEVAAFQT
jgi:site-specific DNA recombinase